MEFRKETITMIDALGLTARQFSGAYKSTLKNILKKFLKL